MLSTADFVSSPTKVAMETEGQSSAETAAVEPMQVDTGERGKESAATEGVCNIQLSCTQSMSFHLPKGLLPLPPLFWPPSFHSFLPPSFPPSFSLLFSSRSASSDPSSPVVSVTILPSCSRKHIANWVPRNITRHFH